MDAITEQSTIKRVPLNRYLRHLLFIGPGEARSFYRKKSGFTLTVAPYREVGALFVLTKNGHLHCGVVHEISLAPFGDSNTMVTHFSRGASTPEEWGLFINAVRQIVETTKESIGVGDNPFYVTTK